MVANYGQGSAVADELASPLMRRDLYRTNDVATGRRDPQIRRAPTSAGLYDVLDLILEKGSVIDAFVRVSLVGIELITVDLRVVIASVDTYLRYAEGVERLQIRGDEKSEPKNLPGMVGGGMKSHALKSGAKSVGRMLTGKGGRDQDDREDESGQDDGENEGVVGALSRGVRRAVGKVAHALGGTEGDDQDEGQHRASPGVWRPSRDRGKQDSRGGGRKASFGARS